MVVIDLKKFEVLISIMFTFLPLLWLMIFINNYRHFPKMSDKQKISLSLKQATMISFGIIILVLLTFFIINLLLI
ncbi:MAG: hypothetical protein QXF76_01945 [Candidatus Anstonellales archaeon]